MAPDPHTPDGDVPTPTTAPARRTWNERTPYTCGGCTNTWTGNVMAHCATCHHTFGSVASFDRHRRSRKGVTPPAGGCAAPADIGLYWNPTRRCWSESYSTTSLQVHQPDPPGEVGDIAALGRIMMWVERGQQAQAAVDQITHDAGSCRPACTICKANQ